ncbi:MAG: hypothetical protein ABII80_00550 [bacterium]
MSTTLLVVTGPTNKESLSFHFDPPRFKLTDPSEEQNFSKLRQELRDEKIPEKIKQLFGCLTCALFQAQTDPEEQDTFHFIASKSTDLETIIPAAYCSLFVNHLDQIEKGHIPNCENFSIVLNLLNT